MTAENVNLGCFYRFTVRLTTGRGRWREQPRTEVSLLTCPGSSSAPHPVDMKRSSDAHDTASADTLQALRAGYYTSSAVMVGQLRGNNLGRSPLLLPRHCIYGTVYDLLVSCAPLRPTELRRQ